MNSKWITILIYVCVPKKLQKIKLGFNFGIKAFWYTKLNEILQNPLELSPNKDDIKQNQ